MTAMVSDDFTALRQEVWRASVQLPRAGLVKE
jgi:hypothetical protein